MSRARRSPVRRLVAALSAGACLACQTSVSVPDAQASKAVSGVWMTCSNPYELSQDCSIWSGATREIDIGDFRMRVAGSADGRIVFLMSPSLMGDSYAGKIVEVTNFAYEVVKRELYAEGITILKVEPVASAGVIMGYIVHADGDAYAVLREHSVPNT